MLQRVDRRTLQYIRDHAWVRQNFILSNFRMGDPRSRFKNAPALIRSFFVPKIYQYATVALVSKTLPQPHFFRVPFTTSICGRDVLVLDFPLSSESSEREPANGPESFRLCTTDLEPLSSRARFRQLAVVSKLLKGACAAGSNIVGGVVAGNMAICDPEEHAYHKAPEVDLKDIWDDARVRKPAPLRAQPSQGTSPPDTTCGWAAGSTIVSIPGQARGKPGRNCKFLYTGSVQTFGVYNAQDVRGRVGRFGIGVQYRKRAKETDEDARVPDPVRCQRIADERAAKLKGSALRPPTYTYPRSEDEKWPILEFGIVTGVKVPIPELMPKPEPKPKSVRRVVKYLGTT